MTATELKTTREIGKIKAEYSQYGFFQNLKQAVEIWQLIQRALSGETKSIE